MAKKWGMLTPLEYIGMHPKKKRSVWRCRCDCGKERIIRSDCLLSGSSKSCGCVTAKRGANNMLWRGFGEISMTRWSRFMRGAEERSLPFTITIEYAWSLFEKQGRKCALSGLPIDFGVYKADAKATASLDRINSRFGYVPGNVWWVHKRVNFMKQHYDVKEYIYFCHAVSKFQGGVKLEEN